MTTANDHLKLPYRACVGIALFNKEGQVFVGERIDSPGAWQMPQGGIDAGEDLEIAAFREMMEEIGTNKADILEIGSKKLTYDLPPHLLGRLWKNQYRGQEQTWIALRFHGEDVDFNLNAHNPPEFQKWKWVGLNEILDLIVPFKKDTYQEVITMFEKHVTAIQGE
tara:strand:+ start:403334 stop:403831 length:498 start_codon:yes stop_codon:yes gene_type:complete